jgi:hypothetical protein
MENRRVFSMLLVLFLILGICVNDVMAEACLCGEACPHGLQDKPDVRASFLFHERCSGTHCKGCNLEKGRAIKAADSSTRTGKAKIFDTIWSIFVLTDYKSTPRTPKSSSSLISSYETMRSLPSYQQDLPLLC